MPCLTLRIPGGILCRYRTLCGALCSLVVMPFFGTAAAVVVFLYALVVEFLPQPHPHPLYLSVPWFPIAPFHYLPWLHCNRATPTFPALPHTPTPLPHTCSTLLYYERYCVQTAITIVPFQKWFVIDAVPVDDSYHCGETFFCCNAFWFFFILLWWFVVLRLMPPHALFIPAFLPTPYLAVLLYHH